MEYSFDNRLLVELQLLSGIQVARPLKESPDFLV